MKKIHIALTALVALFSSCSESISDYFDANHGTEITASMPSAEPIHTRTAYEIVDNSQEPLSVTWEKSGEMLYSVCTSADAGKLNGGVLEQSAVSEDGKSATFKANYTLAAGQLFAFYAGHQDLQDTFENASGNTSVTASLKFEGQTGKYKDLANYDYMTAKVDNVKPDGQKFKMGTLSLQHEIAVVVLKKDMVLKNVGEATKVTKVELQGVPTSGTLTVSRSGDALTSTISNSSTGSITINTANVAITDGKLSEDIYIATLPVSSLANLKVKMTYDNNTAYTYTYSGTATKMDKGYVYDWTPVSDFGFSAQAVDFHIEGVVMQKGVILDANGLTSTLAAADGTKSEQPTVQIKDNKWYSDEACTQALSTKPAKSTTPVYAKYKLLNEPKNYDAKAKRTVTLSRTESSTDNKDVVSAEVTLPDYAEMKFTIKTTSASQSFSVPFATANPTPAKLAIVWGGNESSLAKDGNAATNELSSITADTRKHTYASASTYQIRILSLETDATKKQIPEFNFGKYPSDTKSNSKQNENGELLYSVDSPVLYSGESSLASMFYGTDNLVSVSNTTFALYPEATSMNNVFGAYSSGKLASIPANLFDNNTKVTSFARAFSYQKKLTTIPAGLFDKNTAVTTFASTFINCTSLKSIPSGLFDNNTQVSSFKFTFAYCSALQTVPEGLFAKNLSVTNFQGVLGECTNLKLNENLFIDETNTKSTRFTHVNSMIDFMYAFENVGLTYLENYKDGGTMPDLWNYTYSAKGCGVSSKGSAVYNYKKSGNYTFKDLPSHFSNWKSSGGYDKQSTGWFIGTANTSSPTVLKKN